MADNYFEFFDIPVAFFPDEAEIKRKYYQNSRLFHPDFFTLEDEKKQEEMLEKSSLNNKAFTTLSNYEKRVAYVLSLHIDLDTEQEKGLDPEFLMEMMEWNEKQEDAMFDKDETLLKALKEESENLLAEMDNEIRPVMVSFDNGRSKEEAIQEVRDYYFKRKYILRFQENISTFAGL